MKAEYINPFLNGTINVIKTMASLTSVAGPCNVIPFDCDGLAFFVEASFDS